MSDGIDRRRFLRRAAVAGGVAWATPVVTTIAVSPAAATPAPCFSSPAPAPSIAPESTMDMTSSGSPCLHVCNETQVRCEATMNERLDACTREAGDDVAAVRRCVERFLEELFVCMSDWQSCADGCTG